MSFDAKDIMYFKSFKAVVMKAKFETQGEALTQVGALFQWFNTLEGKIESVVNPPKAVEKKSNRKELK